jgi:RecJ-like exonuclease
MTFALLGDSRMSSGCPKRLSPVRWVPMSLKIERNVSAQCPVCNGTSVIDGFELIRCAGCEGTGKILGSVCDSCDGFGEKTITTKVICPKCLEDAPKFA